MLCENCNSLLHYKDTYCNACGAEVAKGAYEETYKKTIWGKLDTLHDWYETLFLKKLTDHIVFKILLLAAILLWGLVDVYTNLTDIRLLESEQYSIEYNKNADEYYIRTDAAEVDLNLYIPGHAEKIAVKAYTGGAVTKEEEMQAHEENAVKMKKGEFDYITIDAAKAEKVTDSVKLYITE